MKRFPNRKVSTALERSLAAAKHLDPERDAAAVAAARALARRLDELAANGWAVDGRMDNVTAPTFLRYLAALNLVGDLDLQKGSGPRNRAANAPKRPPKRSPA